MRNAPPAPSSPAAALGAWLSVLLVGLLVLNTAGGWVRLSGSGVAIPHWPAVELDQGRRSLLPPLSERDWQAAFAAWQQHQQQLMQRISAGELPPSALGRQPADLGDFRAMFLTEWCHRLLAALVGILALACLGGALRQPELRARIAPWLAAAVALIGVQAWLGAALIGEGTGTRWLFLHQGNAGLILLAVLVALLGVVDGAHRLRPWPAAAAACAWLLLVLGGLLAASRHDGPAAGPLGWSGEPLWVASAGIAANLLDHAPLHQVAHRAAALLLVALIAWAWWRAARGEGGERTRLALSAAATLAVVEAMLGLAAALSPRGEVLAPLAHQFLGQVLFLCLAVAACDPRPAAEAPR